MHRRDGELDRLTTRYYESVVRFLRRRSHSTEDAADLAQDTFARLLAGSIALTFFVYVFINAGMVTGLLPVVGVPLPLVSYGGSSVVTLLAGFGILMALYSRRKLVGS